MSDPFGLMQFAECEHKQLKCEKCGARSDIRGWQTFTGQDKELLQLREENESITARLAAAQTRNECPICGLTPGAISTCFCEECVGELRQRLAAAEAERDRIRRQRDDAEKERHEALGRLAAAEAALKPFAEVARGIPDNWPGECHLRIDGEPVQLGDFIGCREWLCYHGVQDVQDACLPTIEQWREAAKAGGRDVSL